MTHEQSNETSTQELTVQLEHSMSQISSLAQEQMKLLPASEHVRLQGLVRKPQMEAHEGHAYLVSRSMMHLDDQLPQDAPIEDRVSTVIAGMMLEAKALDLVKVKTLGRNAPAGVSNSLIGKSMEVSAFAFMLRYYAAFDSQTHSQLGQYQRAANVILENDSKAAWFAPKIAGMSAALRNAHALLQWSDNICEGADEQAIDRMKDENDQLFAATKAIQRYGVKSAIAPAIDQHDIAEWLIMTPEEFMQDEASDSDHRSNSGLDFTLRNCEAMVIGTPSRFITSKPSPYRTSGRNAAMSGYSSQELLGPNQTTEAASSVAFQITKDGELATVRGLELRTIFEELGALEAYELLRAEMLAIHFDLVTPALIQEVVEQEIKHPSGPKPSTGDTPRIGKLRELVLARQRVIKILGDDIEDVFEQEEAEQRDIVIHDVVNHIRDLPDSYRASQEARDRCYRETGIILPEFGKTYVRKHERGSTPEVDPKGHRTAHRHLGVVATRRTARSGNPKGRPSGRTTPPGTRPKPQRKVS